MREIFFVEPRMPFVLCRHEDGSEKQVWMRWHTQYDGTSRRFGVCPTCKKLYDTRRKESWLEGGK